MRSRSISRGERSLGALAQIVVQLPQTLRLVERMRIDFAAVAASLAHGLQQPRSGRGSRGVGQISGYIDNLLASLLPIGAVSALNYGAIFYMLPMSLFGMSIAAAELPSMSRAAALAEDVEATLRRRLNSGLRQIAFLVVPSAAAFLRDRRRDRRAGFSVGPLLLIAMPFTYGQCWRVRASECSRARWAGSTTRRSTRCGTRGRR